MDFKDFGENAEVKYITQVYINDELAGTIINFSEESHLEDYRKLDHAIKEELTRQFEDLPENIEV